MENISNYMSLDEKDLIILEELRTNSKQRTSRISKKTGIPITTVHNRIKKLEKEGIIKNYTVNIDYEKLGKNIFARILVSVEYKTRDGKRLHQLDIARKIRALIGVELVEIVTGTTDMVVRVRATDIKELNDFVINKLREIDGVDKTQTMIVLNCV